MRKRHYTAALALFMSFCLNTNAKSSVSPDVTGTVLDENGKPTDKVICTTLLYNIFSLQMQRNKNGSYKYPELTTMWFKFVTDCVKINRQRGLYELSEKERKTVIDYK